MMNPDGDLYLTLVQPGSVYWQAGNKHQGWALVEHNQPLRRIHGPVEVKVLSGVLKAVESKDGERFAYFGDAAKAVVSKWPQDAQNGPDRAQGIEYEVELVYGTQTLTARLWACTNGLQHLGLIVGDEVVLGWRTKPLPEGVARARRAYLIPVAWATLATEDEKINETFDRR